MVDEHSTIIGDKSVESVVCMCINLNIHMQGLAATAVDKRNNITRSICCVNLTSECPFLNYRLSIYNIYLSTIEDSASKTLKGNEKKT